MTLVSIITPSYNQASYLEETILSVVEQDHSPLEYFIVDGGSQDGSLDIIQKYSDRLTWWVSERDAGQAEAINKGLARATGEIVAWLNSDDLLLPGAVARAVSALEANPELGMVFGDAITIAAEGQPLKRLAFNDWGLPEFMRFRIICQPAVFMRKACLERAGLLDPSYHYLLDHHLWIRLARLAPVQHIPETLAAARHHPGAKNVAQAAGFGQEALRILGWMETQADLAPFVQKDRRRIEAGAQRLNARYLLDGDLPGPALRAYGRALARSPGFTLRHWHRILYALLSLAGGKSLANLYDRLRPGGLRQ
ncbi:MAG TPA: glycosyltransferase family 2 protein [Anaerolineales bacterium]|nr:glycosyltransferase family 2 protein [Anaerolineales bacterium]